MVLKYPTLNGFVPSWVDLESVATIYGAASLALEDISAIKYGRTIERGVQRGATGRKRKRTTGTPSFEGSITFYQDGWWRFQEELAKKAPRGLVGLAAFDVSLAWSPPLGSKIFKVKMLGCLVNGDALDAAEGNDPHAVEVPLDVMDILVDGKRML